MTKEKKIIQDDEIDLVELVKTIWSGRWFIAKVTGVFILIGLLIAFTNPVEYEVSIKLLPESVDNNSTNFGGLGSLAGLAGIELGGVPRSAGLLSPQFYPEIVNSLPFILDVMNDSIYFENIDVTTTSFDYFDKYSQHSVLDYLIKYTFGLPGLVKGVFIKEKEKIDRINTKEFYRLDRFQWRQVEKFKDRISLIVDDKTGLIFIKVKMPDAYGAAQITKSIETKVTQAVIEYKTDKARQNLEYMEEAFKDAKGDFESIQLQLAKVTDRNLNVSSATAQVELRRIQDQYNLAFEIYKGLATQLEQAKIRLKEQTPVFTVLEPVRVPIDRIEPNRLLIIILFTFIGAFVSLGLVIFRNVKIEKHDRI